MSQEENKIEETPKWLKNLQENSWEAEILISGGSIFSLLQLNNWVVEYSSHLKEIFLISGFNQILVFIFLGVNVITLGFIVHLILRGYWIAVVCLDYGAPKGINLPNLKITGSYLQEAKSINLRNQIVLLDKVSGNMFFMSLACFLAIVGFILVVITFHLFIFLLDGYDVELLFAIPWLIFYLDMFSGGLLRRFKWISRLYRPIYLYFNYVSLAFIYRPWFQVLFTNINRWKALAAGSILLAVALFLTASSLFGYMQYTRVFDDRNLDFSFGNTNYTDSFYESRYPEGERIYRASIQSDLINDNYLRIFIPYKKQYDEFITDQNATELQQIVAIKLDNQPVSNPDWLAGDRIMSNQIGITCFLPIVEIANGKHTLIIELKCSNPPFPFPITIPFWKQ